MKNGVHTVLDRVGEITKTLSDLSSKRVMVGIPAEKGMREPEKSQKGPINNAALAYIHEHGAPEANIPARPFLIPGVKSAQEAFLPRLKEAGKAAFEGRQSAVDGNLAAAGQIAAQAVQRKITTGPFAPLKPRTIAARRRKGQKGTIRPLIDTGQMRQAVTWVIRKTIGK